MNTNYSDIECVCGHVINLHSQERGGCDWKFVSGLSVEELETDKELDPMCNCKLTPQDIAQAAITSARKSAFDIAYDAAYIYDASPKVLRAIMDMRDAV